MEEKEARKEARELYKKWTLLEEASWRQKSREIWLKEGDRNTKFFHQMANAHRRRNQLNRIKVHGRCLTKESEIKEEVSRTFQGLLTDPSEWKLSIDGLNLRGWKSWMWRGWRSPSQRRRFLKRWKAVAERKRQARTVSQWPSGSFLGIL